MTGKLIGALLIIAAGGIFGFSLVREYRKEEDGLRQLIAALDYMQCELQYRMTPLPDLCREAGRENRSMVGQVLLMLAQELDCMVSPDVRSCMLEALGSGDKLPAKTRQAFENLGATLGRFDVSGQIQGLESVRAFCRRELESLASGRELRLRSYKTLSLCAGAALAILLV